MDNCALANHYLDLRGFVCPVNFVKCCLALENLSLNQVLKVDLDIGEAENTVITDPTIQQGVINKFFSQLATK